MICRCGHNSLSSDPHPCHAEEYTCRKPATQRFINTRPVSLAGMAMKLEAQDTWSCDEHWKKYLEKQEEKK